MTVQHTHSWTFLRQEEHKEGFYRNPTYKTYDMYFCSACLEYKSVHIKTEDTDNSTGERMLAWRLS